MAKPPTHILLDPHTFVAERGGSIEIAAGPAPGGVLVTAEDGGGRVVELEVPRDEAIALAVHVLRLAVGDAFASAVAQRAADPLG